MLRTLVFTLGYLVLLGAVSIEVTFTDGLHIKLTGWLEKLWPDKKKKRRG